MYEETTISIEDVSNSFIQLKDELHKRVIGQDDVLEQIIICMMSSGHCLMTGVPGLGKTMIVKTIAEAFNLSFKRIQFTPDLMPADIYGTDVLEEDPATGKREFRFIKGPVFSQILLADEINRTPPKTQAALLEAMGESQVSTGGHTFALDLPFFVLATQNPIELEGTYPLPEAQLDRFLLNVVMDYLPIELEEKMVLDTTGDKSENIEQIFDAEKIIAIQNLVRQVPVPQNVISYAVRLVSSTRRLDSSPQITQDMLKWGAGSRASQALILAGKARALLQGRLNVAIEDVKALARPVLRHRISTNFHADAEGTTEDDIIQKLLEIVPE